MHNRKYLFINTFYLLGIFLLIFTFFNCKNEQHISEKLKQNIQSYTKLRLNPMEIDSLQSLITKDSSMGFTVYSPEGDVLTSEYIRKHNLNMTLDVYGENLNNIKAIVFRKATDAEMKASLQAFTKANQENERAINDLNNKNAPTFITKDMNGNTIDISTLKGKVVVLNFWFIRCYACVQEMPELNDIVAKFKNKDVIFVGLTFDKKEETEAFLKKTKFMYQIIAEAKPIFEQYSISPCPVSIVIDKSGKISFTNIGYEEMDKMSYKKLIAAIEAALI